MTPMYLIKIAQRGKRKRWSGAGPGAIRSSSPSDDMSFGGKEAGATVNEACSFGLSCPYKSAFSWHRAQTLRLI
jgi:hypothetical protein